VHQHLNAAFDKTGARSRREFVAQFFVQRYLPRLTVPSGAVDAATAST
jgi:hypothetical protein